MLSDQENQLRAANGMTPSRPKAGAILMEVVLALGLLVVTASVVFAGLSSSFRAVHQVRFQAQAADLAVTKMSELQMGVLDPVNDGPNPYEEENLAGWSWQVIVTPLEATLLTGSDLKRVEVVVTNTEARCTYRLAQLVSSAAETSQTVQTPPARAGRGGP